MDMKYGFRLLLCCVNLTYGRLVKSHITKDWDKKCIVSKNGQLYHPLIQTNIRSNFESDVNVNSLFNSLLSPISPIIFS